MNGYHPRAESHFCFRGGIFANNGYPGAQIKDCYDIINALIEVDADEIEVMRCRRFEQ